MRPSISAKIGGERNACAYVALLSRNVTINGDVAARPYDNRDGVPARILRRRKEAKPSISQSTGDGLGVVIATERQAQSTYRLIAVRGAANPA